jgi:hypothetical protein
MNREEKYSKCPNARNLVCLKWNNEKTIKGAEK